MRPTPHRLWRLGARSLGDRASDELTLASAPAYACLAAQLLAHLGTYSDRNRPARIGVADFVDVSRIDIVAR
jgi:hypothetical protein